MSRGDCCIKTKTFRVDAIFESEMFTVVKKKYYAKYISY